MIKLRWLAFLSVLGLVMALNGWADSSAEGKWTAEVQMGGGRGGYGGGGPQTQSFTFKVAGDKLTGSVSGGMGETAISDGKVSGDQISFSVTRETQWATIKQHYTGTVAADEIRFKMQVEGRDETTEFTAKRASD